MTTLIVIVKICSTVKKVVLDTKDNLIALALGMITITALGYLAGFEALVAATVAASVVGLASLLSNLYVAAPFLTSFRGLTKSEGWQRFILLRAPSFAFGQLVVLIVLTGGVFRWIQVVAAITAIIMALAFFSQSAQSRAHQMLKADQTRIFQRCVQFAKMAYMLSNVGLQDVVDTWLTSFVSGKYVEVSWFTANIIQTHFRYISKDARQTCFTEIYDCFNLPQEIRDLLTEKLSWHFPGIFEGMEAEELDEELKKASNRFAELAAERVKAEEAAKKAAAAA